MNRVSPLPSHYLSPQLLLDELGVEEPKDIQIEAVAQFLGATVLYEALEGSDARLIGVGERAFITVNERSTRARQRFSVAHELGHWMWDRGKTGFACGQFHYADDGKEDASQVERRANRYAVDLLLPERLFLKHAKGRDRSFATVKKLAELFQTSLTATAIRLVGLSPEPALLICSGRDKRRWTSRSRLLPRTIPLRETPHAASGAARLLARGEDSRPPERLPAATWFDDPTAQGYEVTEEVLRLSSDTALSLVTWGSES